jgi:hypothetical protein
MNMTWGSDGVSAGLRKKGFDSDVRRDEAAKRGDLRKKCYQQKDVWHHRFLRSWSQNGGLKD